MAELTKDSILIFRTRDDEWGEFTNQYTAPFVYMGKRFETVEQFLYYMRAIFGRSEATAEKLLACGGDSAALAKIAKKQRILENNNWDAVRPQVMRRGMRQKFLQNPELRKKLLSTGFRLLVEVQKEGLLGRFLPGSEDWVLDPGKWKNRNQVGRVLMQVRADLRCVDRLVSANEAYVFPDEPFILQTPVGKMTLQEIATLPGARDAVRAYADTAQQYLQLSVSSGDDFINRKKIPLATMERAIARDTADIQLSINRSKARAAADAAAAADARAATAAKWAENAAKEAANATERAAAAATAAEASAQLRTSFDAGAKPASESFFASEAAADAGSPAGAEAPAAAELSFGAEDTAASEASGLSFGTDDTAAAPAAGLSFGAEDTAAAAEGPSFGTNDTAAPESAFGTDDAATAATVFETDGAAASAAADNILPDSEPLELLPDSGPAEDLPDDLPCEGFYELLFDLDEMMKLGIL